MAEEQLQQAYQLIKAGQKLQAEEILRPLVSEDVDNADAWWLLANAVADPDEIRMALDHVLRLRPDHAKSQLMLRRTNDRYPPDEGEAETSFEDLIYADTDDDRPRRVIVTKPKRGSNRLPIVILVVVGILSTISCAVCLLFAGGAVMVDEWLNDPEFAELMTIFVQGFESEFVMNTFIDQGTIERGQKVREELAPFTEHSWTFQGAVDDRVMIDLKALDSDLDPVLHLYGPNGELVAENDDREGSLNSLIEIELPENGTYKIVVSGYDNDGGRYEMKLAVGGPLV